MSCIENYASLQAHDFYLYNMNDLVSILMPVYNAGAYLEACLESILRQTYTNWELLAVNDFSEDESKAILEKYALRDSRIKLLQNTSKGIIPALQLAYRNSKGILITRMDADDLMPSEKLNLLSAPLLEKGRGFVTTGYVQYFADQGLAQGFKNYELWLNSLCDQHNHSREIYKECVIPSPCWMLHRLDLDAIGAFNSELYPEDYELCFRMYEKGLQVLAQQELCHLWRDHQDRASRTDKNYSDNRFIQLKISKFLQIDYRANKNLVLWGAGKKGKALALALIENEIPFTWICDNKKKIGHSIYSQTLKSASQQSSLEGQQIIVAVANPEENQAIRAQLLKEEAYYFC